MALTNPMGPLHRTPRTSPHLILPRKLPEELLCNNATDTEAESQSRLKSHSWEGVGSEPRDYFPANAHHLGDTRGWRRSREAGSLGEGQEQKLSWAVQRGSPSPLRNCHLPRGLPNPPAETLQIPQLSRPLREATSNPLRAVTPQTVP